jgi:hypothetical protein
MTKDIRKASQAVVSKQFVVSGSDSGPEEISEETLAVHSFVTAPANVSVEMGMTLNLGNYESARVTVSVSVPCYKEEVDDAHAYARKWVESRVVKESKKIRDFSTARSDQF